MTISDGLAPLIYNAGPIALFVTRLLIPHPHPQIQP